MDSLLNFISIIFQSILRDRPEFAIYLLSMVFIISMMLIVYFIIREVSKTKKAG
jgi:hypothetical protein